MPPTAILSIFLPKPMAGPHCRTGFSRGVVPRRFLEFSLYWSTGKFKKKRSRTLFRFRLYKRKIGLLIQNDPRRKSKKWPKDVVYVLSHFWLCPSGDGQRTAGCFQFKKAKKKSHRFGYEDLDLRKVRPGASRNQSTAWSKSFSMHSMLGFATSLFSSQPAARVHYFSRPTSCRASHNETPPTAWYGECEAPTEKTAGEQTRLIRKVSARTNLILYTVGLK